MAKKKAQVGYVYNLITLVGLIIAIVGAGLVVTFFAYEVITGKEKPYLGILTYFVFPGQIVSGILIMIGGILFHRNRQRKRKQELDMPQYPRIDLNDPHKRRLTIFFALATIAFTTLIAMASIKGFEFTESPVFCGELCHVPMGPENTAWRTSPHANIRCVECHVGPGADWYLKAKINGTRQLYGVLTGHYEAPIGVPIADRRSAYETCAHCHWIDRRVLDRRKVFTHFAPNEENTPRETALYLKFGGTFREPNTSGIHWHTKQYIEYIPRGEKHEEIPYVSLTTPDGKLVEYLSTEKPMTKDEIAKETKNKRRMDCISCHSRPAHIYRSPSTELDDYLKSGTIDSKLPFIKKIALEVLEKPYKTNEEALQAIENGIEGFYVNKYPKLSDEKAQAVKKAIIEAKLIYSENFFPRMKVNWTTYPNNIGHLYFPGCFRCHDGKHKSAEGRIISKDCNLCHTLDSQKQENVKSGEHVNKFTHPVDIGDEFLKTNCSECHGVSVSQHDKEKTIGPAKH